MSQCDPVINRSRLVLIVPPMPNAGELVASALEGGDVASIILPAGEMESAIYQRHVETLTDLAQEKEVAVIVEDDSQAMGRAGADGLFVSDKLDELKEAIARFSPKRLVGYGGIKSRHHAMEAADLKPDFLFFGRLDGDIKPDAHPKNVALGGWCAEVIRISAITMGGSAIESVLEVSESGVDFVALGLAVFSYMEGPRIAVAKTNALLDEHAPRFSDDD